MCVGSPEGFCLHCRRSGPRSVAGRIWQAPPRYLLSLGAMTSPIPLLDGVAGDLTDQAAGIPRSVYTLGRGLTNRKCMGDGIEIHFFGAVPTVSLQYWNTSPATLPGFPLTGRAPPGGGGVRRVGSDAVPLIPSDGYWRVFSPRGFRRGSAESRVPRTVGGVSPVLNGGSGRGPS